MTSHGTFLTSQQSPIQLGRELGSGGEGKVCEIVGDSSLVAKIYHAPIAAEKQQKLKAMVAAQSGALAKVTIWPKDVLYESINGPMRGIIMPRLHDYKDLFELYIPASRKKAFPNADWKFLIWAARNMAAAVAEMHQAGHVVGDINPKNFVVISDATVRLIDCDSFQISANGRTFLCEVGVPHFTAPELQGKSFRGLTRTPNHDNFALAVLCFHLLFLGRHPFAGMQRSPHDISLEDAISNYYYAFSEKTVGRVIEPPPNTLQATSIPPKLRGMFEAAFGHQGAIGSRPTAQEWTRELELLNKELIGCSVFLSHAYYRTLTQCPWCAIEQAAGVIIFPGKPKPPALPFDLAGIWQMIQGVSSPQPLPQPTYSFSVYPHALPDAILKAEPQKWPWSRHPIDALVAQRKAEFNQAEADLVRTKNQWKAANNAQAFQTKLRELKDLKQEYQALHEQYVDEKRKLEHNAKNLQLHEYLDNQHINRANIPGIGPARRASLISFGIETAADVDKTVINRIPGFGSKLTSELVQWRRQFEMRFNFDPTRGIPPADLAKLEHRYAGKLRVLERKLLAGPKELRDISQRLIAEQQVLSSHMEQKTQSLAQVEVDYNASVMAQRRIRRLRTRWTVGTFTSALVVVALFASVQMALVGDLTILRTVLPGSLGIVQMPQTTQTSAPSVSNTKVPDVIAMTTEEPRLPTAMPARPAATATPARPATTAMPARPAATATPARPAATATPARPAATVTPARPAATATPKPVSYTAPTIQVDRDIADGQPTPAVAVVRVNSNLRAGPGTNREVLRTAAPGTKVIVTGSSDDGLWLRLAGGEWISADLITLEADVPSTAKPAVLAPEFLWAVTVRNDVNVYTDSISSASVAQTLRQGDCLQVVESSPNWVEVRYLDNKTGWCASSDVMIVSSCPTATPASKVPSYVNAPMRVNASVTRPITIHECFGSGVNELRQVAVETPVEVLGVGDFQPPSDQAGALGSGPYLKIRLWDGQVAWIAASGVGVDISAQPRVSGICEEYDRLY